MKKKVPEIRFRGFDGEWEEKKLNYFVEKIAEKNTDYRVKNVISNSAKNGLISQLDFFDKDIANKGNIDKYYIIKKDDFVYNPRKSIEAPYGPINRYKYDEEGVVSPLYYCFRVNQRIDKNYLQYYFKSDKWHRFIYRNGDQGARHDRVSIKDSEFINMNIRYPSINEQKRIGNFLIKVDKLIEKQDEKVKNYELYKKGMMQKIFSQEIRFRGDRGEEYPEWEERKLKEIFKITAGGDISKENVSSYLVDKFIYPIYSNSLNENGLYGYSDVYKVEGETLTVTGRGTIGVAKARYEKYFPIVRLLVLRPKEKCNVKFFEETINITKIYVESTGVPQLTAPQLSKIKVNVPCLEEQNKIANFLYKVDSLIEKEEEKLENFKSWKRGLLQGMFV